jgi:hypothetical protein
MSGSANAVQRAIWERLAGDPALTALLGADGVIDRRVTGKAMPYVVLSEIATADLGAEIDEHRVTVEVWSDASGRREAQTIAAHLRAALDGADLALADCALVGLAFESSRSRREPRSRAQVTTMLFRAVTD